MSPDGSPVRGDVLSRFDAAALAEPRAAALTCAGVTLDRGALRRRVAALARRLGPEVGGQVVGIALERSVDLVVAQLACWAVGAASCVLDPTWPPAYLARQLDQAGAATVVSAGAVPLPADVTVVRPDAGEAEPTGPLVAGGLAYVIFTSGSTGQPRAVAVTHANLAAVALAWQQRYDLERHRDHVLQVAATTFDVAVGDLVRTTTSGGRLVLPTRDELADPYRLLQLARTEQVSYLEITPSLLAALDSVGATTVPSLRCLVLGGERVDAGHLRIARQLLGLRGRLFNTYGLTECTIDSTVVEIPAGRFDAPLGEPFAGTTLTVRDPGLAPTVEGQGYVGGRFVALGYLGDPAGTAERFVPDPDGEPGSRMFRTGDRLRRRGDELTFLGRVDRQVKLSGVRVDLEEVERRVAAQPGVAAAAVVLTDGRLVAHVAAAEDFPGTDRLRAGLAAELPPSHRPTAVVRHDRLPVTAGGKVDRDRLADTGARADGDGEEAPASNDLAVRIAAVMAELVGGPADPDGDFFGHGGTSLQATVLLGRLRRELGVAPDSAAELWRQPTPRRLATVCRPVGAPQLGPDRERAPLSPGQRRMWLQAQLRPDDAGATVSVRVSLTGEVYVAALSRAVDQLVARHPALRTVVALDNGGQPYAVVRPPSRGTLRLRTHESAPDPLAEPWDLTSGPLFRAVLTRRPGGGWLDLAAAHLVLDGESVRTLLRELEAYAGGQVLPPPAATPAQLADLDVVREQSVGYWRTALVGAPAPLPAPRGGPTGGWQRRELDAEVGAGLDRRAAQLSTSAFVLQLAAWFAVQRRWLGADDVVVGVPFGDRRHSAADGVVGFFVDTVPVRVDLAGLTDVTGLVAAVHTAVTEARRHRDAPYDEIAHAAGRSGSDAPLFGSWFNHLGPADRPPRLRGLTTRMVDPPRRGGLFDVDVYLERHGPLLRLDLVAGADGPDDPHAAALADQLVDVLTGWSRGGTALGPTPAAAEPHPGHPALPHREALGRAVRAALAADPTRVVVRGPSGPVDAGAVAARGTDLAARLGAAGVAPGALVALVGGRTVELVGAVLAVVAHGYRLCVLDAALPQAWRTACLDAARPDVVLTLDPGPGAAPREGAGLGVGGLLLRADGRRDADHVAFTTGTTGTPRPVRCGYPQLAAVLEVHRELTAVGPGDRVPVLAGLGHDPLLREVLGSVLAGAELLVPPPGLLSAPRELADWLGTAGATVAHVTPVLLRALAAEATHPLGLRLVVSGGDLLHPSDTAAAATLAPSAALLNVYGTTETPQIVAAGPGPVAGVGPARLLLRRPDGQPCRTGEVGEIVVESPALALGYGDAGTSAGPGFEPGGCPGCRRFATGDRGRRRADGTVEVLGRSGDEVSVGAERVDLVALAALLRRELGVHDAVALALQDGPGTRLAAFVVPTSGTVDPVEVRRRLRRAAPPAYVPALVVGLAAIPRDANGKVDRRALLAEAAAAAAAPARVSSPRASADGLADLVAEAYAAVLGVTDVPRDANFFELGGSSLAMAAVVHLLRQRLGRPLPTLLLFEHPSVDTLAAALAPGGPQPVVPAVRTSRGPSDASRRTALRRAIRSGGLP